MEITVIAELLQVALPTGLIVVITWWALTEGWPYWKTRDQESRQREYDRELAQIASVNVQSEALTSLANAQSTLADAIRTCPLK